MVQNNHVCQLNDSTKKEIRNRIPFLIRWGSVGSAQNYEVMVTCDYKEVCIYIPVGPFGLAVHQEKSEKRKIILSAPFKLLGCES